GRGQGEGRNICIDLRPSPCRFAATSSRGRGESRRIPSHLHMPATTIFFYPIGIPPPPPSHNIVPTGYSLPSGNVAFSSSVTLPPARPVPPSFRGGWPSTFTRVPTSIPAFQPTFWRPTIPPAVAVMRQRAVVPSLSVTSTVISECGLTILSDFTTPSISIVLS